jgi:autotransporter-associated beta strand protein
MRLKRPLLSLAILLTGLSLGLSAQTTYFWRGEATDGNWNVAFNWWNGSGTSLLLGNEIIRFDNNNQTTMTNNAANTSRYRIFFDGGATTARAIAGTATNNFFDFGGNVPQIVNNSTANHAINFPINASWGGGLEINASNGPLTIGGVISGAAGNELLFWGGNNVTLNAANTYTGETQINNGTLTLGASGNLAAGSNVFLGNGTVAFNAALVINNNNSYGNNLTVNTSSGSGTRTLTIGASNTPSLSGSFAVNRALEINSGASANLTLSGVVSGASNVSKTGSGNLTLSGATANSYSGDLTVSAGTLTLNKSAGTKAADDVIVSVGATLSTNAANQWGVGTPPLITNNGTFNLNNHNQRIALVGNGSMNLGSATVTISNTGTDVYSGSIAGTGGLTKEGTGTQTLSGSLTYTGTTTISAGTLVLSSALSSANVVVNGTLTLQSGAVLNVSSLTVNGTLNVQSGATLNVLAGGNMLVNGTLNMNGGNLVLLPLAVPTATISYGGSSNLIYSAGGTISPNQEWPLSSGPNSVQLSSSTTLSLDESGLSTRVLTIDAFSNFNANSFDFSIPSGGSLTCNGIYNAGTGTLTFAGSATVGGTSARNFYDVVISGGLVNFGTGPGSTINNSLEILPGGGVVTNKPTYAAGSTLIYNTGGEYFSNLEWETTSPAARPHHIEVIGGTDLILDNPYVFECNGNLSISGAGTSVVVDASAGDVGVFGNFTLGAGASMTLSTELGDDLFVRGNWSNSGTFNSNDRAVFFDQGGTQTISGNTTIDFVVVDKSGGSVTLQSGATLNIAQGMTTTSNFTVAAGGTLRFRSTPTRTAWLNNYSGSGNVVGTMIMERYVPGSGIGYHFIGAPVGGATIGAELSELSPSGSGQIVPLPGCDPTQIDAASPYGNVFRWIESAAGTLVPGCEQDGWHVVSGATAMTLGEGFAAFINGGSTIDVSGSAQNGTVNYGPLSNSGGDGDGWQMVSNPFPSPIVWTAPSGFETGAHFFQTTGTYTGTFQVEASGTGYIIESMQSFQVRVPSGSATFSLGNANRTTDAGSFFRTASWYEQLLVLDVDGNGFRDKTTVYFVEGATDAYEPLVNDASKRLSRSVQPTLYTLIDGQMTGINALAPLAAGPRSVPLALKPGQNGNFTLSVKTLEGFPASALVLLEDLETGTITNLMEVDSYSFTMSTSEANERFVLHFVPGAELTLNATACDGSGGSAVVNIPAATWDTYQLINSELMLLESGLASEPSLIFSDLSAGEYRLLLSRGGYEASENLLITQPAVAEAGFETAEAEGYYAGEPIQWLDRSAGAADYRWDFGDGTILSGVAEPLHSYASPGEYRIVQEVWSADGCADLLEQSLTVQARISGIEDEISLSTLVWNQGLQVFVEGEGLLAGTPLRLLDLTGRTVAAQTCNSSPCSIEAPAAGAYLLMLGEGVQPARKLILHD